MLADELIPDKRLPRLYDGFDRVLAKIEKARKFVLARDFTVASDGLVDNMIELERIAPFCRLPYPLCWFEWLQSDRPNFLSKGRPVDPSRFQCPPHRIGMLCEQEDDRASTWTTHLFWSLKTTPVDSHELNASLMANFFDTEARPEPSRPPVHEVYDVREMARFLDADNKTDNLYGVHVHATASELLSAMVNSQPSDFGSELLLVCAKDKAVFDRVLTCAIEDWGGEVRFLFSLLGLLNCRNVPVLELVDRSKQNRKRVGRGKLPFFSHTLLKVHPLQKKTLVRDVNSHEHHVELRAHFVRGHFKQRKSGLYWWSMHRRGNPERGEIEKDYEVT